MGRFFFKLIYRFLFRILIRVSFIQQHIIKTASLTGFENQNHIDVLWFCIKRRTSKTKKYYLSLSRENRKKTVQSWWTWFIEKEFFKKKNKKSKRKIRPIDPNPSIYRYTNMNFLFYLKPCRSCQNPHLPPPPQHRISFANISIKLSRL